MGSRHRDWDVQCKVYVGNLGNNATKNDLESAFNKYGPLKNVWVARNPPGFAFIEYEDPRDAEDAVSHLDGTRMSGNRIKVEMSTGRTRGPGGGGGGGGGRDSRGGGGRGGYGGGGSGGRRDFGRRRSNSRSPARRRGYGDRSRSRSRSPVRGGRDRYSRSASGGPRERRERSASG